MNQTSLSNRTTLFAATLLTAWVAGALAWLGAPPSSAHAQELTAESPNATAWNDLQYQESGTCALCHAGPTALNRGQGSLDLVLMAEYSIWKTHDKHAQAYAVLEGKRGQQMEKILGVKVTETAAGCLNCHAMGNLKKGDVSVEKYDGVSCGGCHGPSLGWNNLHATPAVWRKKTSQEKFALGMRDLRDPMARAELCYSCHIGNAAEGKVVTHAMFAAGHPPLPPIELSTFSRNEPQHWRDGKDVPYFDKDFRQAKDPAKLSLDNKEKNYHLEDKAFARTRFALVGAAVALRETMKLTADRAEASPKSPKVVWPELLLGHDAAKQPGDDDLRAEFKDRWPELAMATSDCFACHHDLKYPGFRQARGFGFTLSAGTHIAVRPGRPLVRLWPAALLETAAAYAASGESTKDFETRLKALAAACDTRPFGEPGQIRAAARGLEQWAGDLAKKLQGQGFNREAVLTLMHNLCGLYEPKDGKESPLAPDYEAARQIASLLAVAYEDYRSQEAAHPKMAELLARLGEDLNLQPYIRRQDRGKVILDVVRRITMTDETKGSNELSAFVQSLGDRTVDQAKLEAMIANPFLNVLRTAVDPRKFTDELISNQDVIGKLQKFGDEEETNTLRRVAAYDPKTFKANLRALGKLLPAK